MRILKVYECLLELKEDVMFVSTEIGNEYHAYGLIGNTALPYALSLIKVHYKSFVRPMHQDHFKILNKNEIYITPGTFLGDIAFKMERFNCMPDRYNLTWHGGDRKSGGRRDNYPDEGWFKMIRRNNKAIFYILSKIELELPQYIRIGKFMSKCGVTSKKISYSVKSGDFTTDLLLRAEDIPPSIELTNFEKIPIQNGMYLRNCEFSGEAIELKSDYFRNALIPNLSTFYCALEAN